MVAIVSLFSLMLVILIHELGHYVLACRFGAKPVKFSIGMGSSICSFYHKGTVFSLGWIPIGGYIELPAGCLDRLTARQNILLSLGGPAANLILCLALCLIAVPLGIVPEGLKALPMHLQLLEALKETAWLFIVLVPLTFIYLFEVLIHPVNNFDKVSGPIGMMSGEAIPKELVEMFPLWGQALVIIYVTSLGIGTFNLMPLSVLDGGQVFRIVFSRFANFLSIWRIGSTLLLVALMIYAVSGDLIRLAMKAMPNH